MTPMIPQHQHLFRCHRWSNNNNNNNSSSTISTVRQQQQQRIRQFSSSSSSSSSASCSKQPQQQQQQQQRLYNRRMNTTTTTRMMVLPRGNTTTTTTGKCMWLRMMMTMMMVLFATTITTTSTTSVMAVESSASTTSITAAGAAAVPNPQPTSLDLFDQIDRNHDHIIDRMEYTNGMTTLVSQLQQQLRLSPSVSTSSTTPTKSFTTWLLHDIFSYDATNDNTDPTAAATDAASSTTSITVVVSIWSGFWKAFTSSVMMILATEIGDKTFFIAAILSMKHSRTLIFSGSILALMVMTIISTCMGLILPKFLDRKYTHLLSGLLFLYFGCKLLYDSRTMEHGKVSEELEEVEEELLQHNHPRKNKKKGDDDDLEGGGGGGTNKSSSVSSGNNISSRSHHNSHHNSVNVLSTYAILMMAFTLTFVAEWGDRSQIATIALASAKNPIGVTVGSIIGHSICTASACIGGRMLASNISEKTVSQYGGGIFLLFGFHSLFFEQ